MKFAPIAPARIAFGDGPPSAPDFGDVYHPCAGALEQARHVFLAGNDLPGRWQQRTRFVVLETGFGLGNNFLATWAAWRDDPRRCERLWFVSIDKHPPTRVDLARAHAASPLASLAAQLVAAWPPLTPDLHTLAFDGGRVVLRLAFGDVAAWLPQLVLDADAFYLDGFAPDRNPAMWDAALLKQLAGRAAPGATAATWSVARPLRDGLAAAGFEVQRAPGFGGKREMTVARFAPRFVPRRARPHGRSAPPEAAIVGGGLAGAAVAQALAAEGWACTVIDRHPEPAAETSGNAGGLFHGGVPAADGAHARALRAAALLAASSYAPLLRAGIVEGRAQGLLQTSGTSFEATRARVERHGLPEDYVRALDAADASALAGVPIGPAWHFPGGGWLAPASWVRHALDHPSIRWHGGAAVRALRRDGDAWRLLDADGRTVARSASVVLANAHEALALLGHPAWPLQRVRGQVTLLGAGLADVPRPALPLTGDGYALALPDGRVLCGATRAAGDDDPALRAADHAYNLQRLRALCGRAPALDAAALAALDGRVGWRLSTTDRLPVVGPVPAGQPAAREREAARADGLFVCTALGARGITWAPLAGALLAAWAAGAPFPLEADLIDAFDPARFAVRAARGVRTSSS